MCVCVCNAYVRPGLLDWPGQGLVALSLWLGGAGGIEAWGAGWLGGAGAGPGCLIENALKAATFQKHKKKHKKAREKQKLDQKKKENDFDFFGFFLCYELCFFCAFFCAMNCVFFCAFFVL